MVRLFEREEEGEFHLTLGGTARLILRDEHIQNNIQAQNPKKRTRHAQDMKIILVVLLSVILGGVFFWQGLPLLARPLVFLVSDDFERKIGASAQAELLKDSPICDNPQGVKALGNLSNRLFEPKEDFPHLEIKIVKNEQNNALALPGGFILIFEGLLDEAHSPDLIAAILAHEAGHVVARHGIERLITNLLLWLVYGLFTSDVFSFSNLFLLNLADSHYTRSMENDADQFARQLMKAKQIDSKPLISWLRSLNEGEEDGEDGEGDGFLSYFSTHPSPNQRAAFFEMSWHAKPSLSAAQWVALKNICSP